MPVSVKNKKQAIYPQFTWWQGIVEDRYDPDKLGRYKVRIFGYHTNDKTKMPTEELPWAIPMQPVTSAGISGVGTNTSGLVEGSAVIGFFADGPDGQIPIIMGSWGSMSYLPEDADGKVIEFDRDKTGFYDPNGVYPRQKKKDEFGEEYDEGKNVLKEADSSRLSRGGDVAEEHFSLKAKRDIRIGSADVDDGKKIGKAFAPEMTVYEVNESSLSHPNADPTPSPKYEQEFWEEPHPQGVEKSVSEYPHNKVTETETGHIFEVDDTPGAGRIHQMHNSGTYEEIQPDGTRSVRIQSEDYEIVISNKHLLVKGDFNITVEGDYNLNVLGNKYEDIQGHSFETVRGSKVSKTQGNRVEETLTDKSSLVVGNQWETVQCNQGQGVVSKRIAGEYIKAIGRKNTTTYALGTDVTVNGDYKIATLPSFGVDLTESGIEPVITYGDFQVLTAGDVTLATKLTPNFNGTFPTVSLQSAYINTMGTMGHLEAIGIVPVIPPLPGQIVGKRIMNSVTAFDGTAYDEKIMLGNVARTVAVGNTVDTVVLGAMTQTVGTSIIQTAPTSLIVTSPNLTTNLVSTSILGTTGITLTAPLINLN
tara:strand:- start:1368 stop:3137 length:1770 start_codon:yes stop_codon:yes gene_type:complete